MAMVKLDGSILLGLVYILFFFYPLYP